MAVPKKKTSRSRTRRRKAAWKVGRPRTAPCPQCRSPKLPHRACPNCGTYRGHQVLATE